MCSGQPKKTCDHYDPSHGFCRRDLSHKYPPMLNGEMVAKSENKESPHSGTEPQHCGEHNSKRIDMLCALGAAHRCVANVNDGYCAEGTGECMFQVQSTRTSSVL